MRAVLAFFFVLSSAAFAGGFAVSEQDATATGRGGSGTTLSSSSAVHYNPANLAGLTGVRGRAGLAIVAATATAEDPATGKVDSSEGGLATPPHAYLSYGGEKWGVGFGFNAPFGGGLAWPSTWRGRYEIVSQNLQVLGFLFGGAYQLTREFSAGASLTVYRAQVALDKRADFVDRDGKVQLTGSGTGFAPSLGLGFSPGPELKIALVARAPANLTLKGRAHFEDVPPAFSDMLVDQAITAELPLPAKVGLGGEIDLDFATFFAEAEYTFWSAFERFAVDFEEEATPDVKQPRTWSNGTTVRVGAQKDFSGFVGRTGLVFDAAVSPSDTLSPSQPDSTRIGFSIGAGKDLGPVHGNLAYVLLGLFPRASTGEVLAAKYGLTAHLISLTLEFRGPGEFHGPGEKEAPPQFVARRSAP